MTDTNTDQRITNLELKLMDQEETIHDLSDMVNKQWQELERLKAKLTSAHSRIMSLEEGLPAGGADNQKPPHY